MSKIWKWSLITFGSLAGLFIVGSVLLTLFLPLEQIKDLAVARLSETLHRQVRIEKVSFNLLSGIKLEKLTVGNRPGFAAKPFVSADAIELRYALWPLFSRQLLIKEIRLVKPAILIEKNRAGETNFSDLTKPGKPAKAASPSPPGKLPFNLLVASFSLTGGKLTYADAAAGTSAVNNLNVSVTGFELALVKPIDFKLSADLLYQGKAVPAALSGQVSLDMEHASAALSHGSLSLAGEKADFAAGINNWQRPDITFSVSSGSLSVDPLLAPFAAAPAGPKKGAMKPGELTALVNRTTASLPGYLTARGDIKIDNLSFQKFKLDKVNCRLSLAGKVARAEIKEIKLYDGRLSGRLTADLNVPGLAYSVKDLRLEGFNAAPFSNAVVGTFLTALPDHKDLLDKVYGTLDLSAALQGRGIEPKEVMANLSLDGSLTLKHGELKRLKTLAEIGKTLKSNSLQRDLKFGALYSGFSFRDQVATARGLKIEENDFKLYFTGGADLKTLQWVPGNRLSLKLAPALTSGLAPEFTIFRDKDGWLELTFEITGGLKLPLPKPILAKPLETAVGKMKVKVEAKKVEIENAAQKAAQEKVEAEKSRLQEEAKNQLQQLFKH
ncbi:MAG: AsmA family protein [Candidatus Saganbacteria bacterium]|nr:AsmA family protein [Candidatus Saganbacteria bacterium]